MSENTTNLIEDSNRAELNAYLNFKKRAFEEVTNNESESSQSSMSDLEIKRTKKIDYFSGPGEKKWVPNSWLILGDTNVTKLFLKFRDQNIQAVEKTGNINSMRVLSLSYIFPINGWDTNFCITSYVKQTMEVLHAFAYKEISMPKISDECMLYLKKAFDALDNDDVDISTFTFEPASELDVNVKAACLEFVSSLAIKCSKRSEDMFFDRYIKPLIREAVLKSCSKDFICSGPNKFSKYQVEDDFVKLCKHMKYSIDNQAAIGIEAPVALGLWCEGFVCSLMKMTLVEEGIYVPVVLRKFRLPESESELISLSRAMECLNFVLEEVKSFPEKYNARTKKAIKKIKTYILCFIGWLLGVWYHEGATHSMNCASK
ncbi:hypothetical protein RO3G_15804 [Rhizopus delemar RA 99-880]|uniref:Uncharacterized protein n=1 Tax=Rhizopus delemar (strain RA 99-880 / ATCC MYA-4621 / FGSC 9543 / NRRL 43880) TaxID=246409 RepID=I1CRL3_RHIO9|nr:hypothetical protein RO3G_15804 [Rhizopus delemar RA 99-880]|eukprot:EIE91093.1 hypothetical protein RO3G_15804 [Rhizopus delemar RA 99-880]